HLITLAPIAAILVASIRLHCLDVLLHLKYRGPNVIAGNASLRKGQEMGWFQHGSTIIVFAPRGSRSATAFAMDRLYAWGSRCLAVWLETPAWCRHPCSPTCDRRVTHLSLGSYPYAAQ